jgi:hypothetical protein
MAEYTLETSRQGRDVKTDLDQYKSFHSNYPILKIIAEGEVTLTSTVTSIAVAHGLGYAPLYMVFASGTSDNTFIINKIYMQSGDLLGAGDETYSVTAMPDSTNLYIDLQSSYTQDVVCHYIIFADPLDSFT